MDKHTPAGINSDVRDLSAVGEENQIPRFGVFSRNFGAEIELIRGGSWQFDSELRENLQSKSRAVGANEAFAAVAVRRTEEFLGFSDYFIAIYFTPIAAVGNGFHRFHDARFGRLFRGKPRARGATRGESRKRAKRERYVYRAFQIELICLHFIFVRIRLGVFRGRASSAIAENILFGPAVAIRNTPHAAIMNPALSSSSFIFRSV